MDGVVVLDKPEGMTSQGAVNKVKNALQTKRAGHTGTLDPFATGVLPICLGEATKVIPFLDEDFKEYEAVLRLGVVTDTMDRAGRVTGEKGVGAVNEKDVVEVFSKFRGRILQIPPMFSALKKNGVRLYDIARRGEEVDRPPRTVEIKELKLLDLNVPFIRFFVRCSRGTYVRVLGSDIGGKLRCGGHLVELRRVRSGRFSMGDTVSVEDIKRGNIRLIPLSEALSHIGEINVTRETATQIRTGKQIKKLHLDPVNISRFEVGDKLKVCENTDLVSIAEALVNYSDLNKLNDRAVVLKLLRVFN